MTVDEVYSQVERLSKSRANGNANGDGGTAKLLEITGGEPMLQEREVVPLMQRLLDGGYTVLVETSGERPLAASGSCRLG